MCMKTIVKVDAKSYSLENRVLFVNVPLCYALLTCVRRCLWCIRGVTPYSSYYKLVNERYQSDVTNITSDYELSERSQDKKLSFLVSNNAPCRSTYFTLGPQSYDFKQTRKQ